MSKKINNRRTGISQVLGILILLLPLLNSSVSSAQTNLTIEGTIVNNGSTGNWNGINIPRNVPTKLTYRNNSITSVNTQGYMLQAGDEAPGSTNNNLDGETITGNKFIWNGSNGKSVITHGLFAGYNINSVVRYNYLDKVPYGIIFKSGTDAGVNMTFTSGGCAYNICKNGKFAGRAKGINGVKFYNNTFYSGDGSGWYLLLITGNMDRSRPAPSIGTKVFNNIFYSTIQIPMIKIESGCLTNFECDYNIYWCAAGEPTFNIDGVTKTWAQWRARGYDAHSRILNPNFINTIDFVPLHRLDYGTNLGAEWETGLSTNATWIAGSSPSTTNQNGTWQVGAHIYAKQDVYVSSINVTGSNGSSTISTDNGSLQLSAEVLPSNATNKSVAWSLTNGTGQAVISPNGLVSAIADGTVTATATANDGSSTRGSLIITISNQAVPVSEITVSGAGGASIITSSTGTLQLIAQVLPANADNKTISWSVVNGTGRATINSTGLVTSIADGTVTARATATDGSSVYGEMIITIASLMIPVTGITVTGAGGAKTITSDNGNLQLSATVLPANSTNKNVTWSLVNGTGQASINTTGMVTAIGNGTVTAKATANDGSGVYGTMTITISNQQVLITSITVTGAEGASIITTDKGTLQMNAAILPSYATNKSVAWTISNGTGKAMINLSGLVTATDNGVVTVRATATDGSEIYGTLDIVISGQIIRVTNIIVSGEYGANTITEIDTPLQLNALVSPDNATFKNVTWSIESGTELAKIDSTGLVTAVNDGTITAKASANDDSGIFGTMNISIYTYKPKPMAIIVNDSEVIIELYEDFISWKADLYSFQGSLVRSKVVDSSTIIFDTFLLPMGLYIFVLSNGERLIVEKIMVE